MKTKNITVVTCTRDRHDQLKKTMSLCQKIDSFYKHLIIDWNSTSSLELNKKEKTNSKVYKVKNENRWWLTRAYNTGFNLVDTEYILKLDADVKLNFIKFNKLNFNNYDLIVFFDKPNDPGNFLIKKELLEKINGFNEYMWEWGWSDHDLILRAKKIIDKNKYLDAFGYIEKIEHSNETRSIVNKNKIFRKNDLYFYSLIKAYNNSNALLSKKELWTKKNKLDYSVSQDNILVNHFYSLKNLNFGLKLSYKFEFIKSFFEIYKANNRVQKRIYIYTFFILPEFLLNYLSLSLYPKKQIT